MTRSTAKNGTPGLGARIRELREEAGFSVTEVCRRSGMARESISRIETGKVDPQMGTLLRITDAIGARITIRLNPETPPAQT